MGCVVAALVKSLNVCSISDLCSLGCEVSRVIVASQVACTSTIKSFRMCLSCSKVQKAKLMANAVIIVRKPLIYAVFLTRQLDSACFSAQVIWVRFLSEAGLAYLRLWLNGSASGAASAESRDTF